MHEQAEPTPTAGRAEATGGEPRELLWGFALVLFLLWVTCRLMELIGPKFQPIFDALGGMGELPPPTRLFIFLCSHRLLTVFAVAGCAYFVLLQVVPLRPRVRRRLRAPVLAVWLLGLLLFPVSVVIPVLKLQRALTSADAPAGVRKAPAKKPARPPAAPKALDAPPP